MEEPQLRKVSFIVHATRGVIRDQKVRRKMMLGCLIAAVVLLIAGSTILQTALDPRAHRGWFFLFWFGCAWLTLTAMLLALFDLLALRLESRRARRALRENAQGANPNE